MAKVEQYLDQPVKAEVVDGVKHLVDSPALIMAAGSYVAAQAYADRVWAGQSVSLSRHERMGRIAAALEAQGLSMEGVTLP